MDEKRPLRLNALALRVLVGLGGLVLCLLSWPGNHCAAADIVENYDDVSEGTISWGALYDRRACRMLDHRRVTRAHEGLGAEYFHFQAADQGTVIEMKQTVPPTEVLLDETHLSLWVRSSRAGCRLSVNVVLPNQVDTTTNEKPLRIRFDRFEGNTYTDEGQWQQLHCRLTRRAIASKLSWARDFYDVSDIDTSGMYIERVFVTTQTVAGPVEYLFDELRLGPQIKPSQIIPVDRRTDGPARSSPAEFWLDKLSVEGKPTFLRILPYHHEDPEELARLRFNTVWIPDFRDTAVLQKLRAAGLWGIAIPPQATNAEGELLDARTASLAPFDENTDGILAWYLGTGIPGQDKKYIANWIQQLQGADNAYRRPFMGDVAGLEYSYSLLFKMLGASRDVLHTDLTFREYRDALVTKRNTARPGWFLWTWVATEPSPELVTARTAHGWRPVVVEPEQIRLQVYAALQAGYRGIGFMKSHSLNDDLPGSLECKLILQQLNMELDLMEPWLARGTLRSTEPVRISLRQHELRQRNLFGGSRQAQQNKNDLLRAHADQQQQQERLRQELEAAVISNDEGDLLILPAWLEEGASFVPGRLGGENAQITIPGVHTTAVAYEITTTGVRSLDGQCERTAGGLRITLDKFDQTAMILVTSNHRLKAELDHKATVMAAESARVALQLAQTKFERVRRTDAELAAMGYAQTDGAATLRKSEVRLRMAQQAMRAKDFNAVRILSGEAMQALRILQRAHFNDAVRKLSSPVASPHTLCFETLPDHWEMMARLGTSPTAPENMLRSGDFEDIDTMIAEGWDNKQRITPGVIARAELAPHPSRDGGDYSLRLAAVPTDEKKIPVVIAEPPVTVTTPPLTVHSGQVIHISGRIRIRQPIKGSADGVLVYDSLGGPSRGIRWQKTEKWQYFELIREATSSRSMTVTMSLTGMGDVLIDQLSVKAFTPTKSIGSFRHRKHHDPRRILSGSDNPAPPRIAPAPSRRRRPEESIRSRRNNELRRR